MRFFRRRKSVVERIEAYASPACTPWAALDDVTLADGKNAGEYLRGLEAAYPRHEARMVDNVRSIDRLRDAMLSPGGRNYTAVWFPTSVEGCLLAEQFEDQLKRRGLT